MFVAIVYVNLTRVMATLRYISAVHSFNQILTLGYTYTWNQTIKFTKHVIEALVRIQAAIGCN